MNGQSQRRAAALLEVLGVYLAGPLAMYEVRHLLETYRYDRQDGFPGPLAMYEVRHLLGVSLTNPLNNLTARATNAELVTASGQMFVLLMFQYASYFMLAVPLNWWYRRRGRAAFGLTRAGRPFLLLLLAGVGGAALADLPVLSLSLANSIHPSPTAPWRQALMGLSLQRWQVWLFTGVSSWALIPFVEELFYRGYCQRRLAEDWGDGPAIIGAACLFTFTHTQYLMPNAYSIGMVIGLLLSAIGFGVVFAWTRSLIPPMIAHALFDIPMTTIWQSVLVAGLAIGAVLVWPRAVPIVKQTFSTARPTAWLTLGIIGAAWAVLASRDEPLTYAGAVGMVVLAVVIEAKDRLRRRAENEASA